MTKKTEDFNLLIVDDEEALRNTLAKRFALDGHRIFVAADGNAAIEIVMNNDIDFVVSDVMMPGCAGEELLKKIREFDPRIPIVVMVSGFTKLTKERALELGAIDLLPKPIDLELLDRYIAEAMS